MSGKKNRNKFSKGLTQTRELHLAHLLAVKIGKENKENKIVLPHYTQTKVKISGNSSDGVI